MAKKLNKGHFLANYEHCVDNFKRKYGLLHVLPFHFKRKQRLFKKKQSLGLGSGGAPL